LPGGRRYFTFDTEAEANNYGDQWRLMKMANIDPPAELLRPVGSGRSVGSAVRDWANSGLAAPSQQIVLAKLIEEVGFIKLSDTSYTWLTEYVHWLKVKRNLAPSSVRQRVQALGRSLDEWNRHHQDAPVINPVRMLPKGYSTYSEVDKRVAEAGGKKAKIDVTRDRRLHPGEEDRIIAALSGVQRDDRQRALSLPGGNAMLTMFLIIVYSGLRLREAYTLKRSQIDLENKVMTVQSTKQWRGKVVYRSVPMRQEVHRALVAYLSTRSLLPGARMFPFMDEEGAHSLTVVSQRLSARYRIAFEYAGCHDLREHDLRHEATCRWLEMKGADGNWLFRLEELNKFMGWSAGSTMAQRYASFRGSDLAQRIWVTEAPPQAKLVRLGGPASV
jgi:integrase